MNDLRTLIEYRAREASWRLGGVEYYSFWYSRSGVFRRGEASDAHTGILAAIWAEAQPVFVEGDEDFADVLGLRREGVFVLDPTVVSRDVFWRCAGAGHWRMWSPGPPPARVEALGEAGQQNALICLVGARGAGSSARAQTRTTGLSSVASTRGSRNCYVGASARHLPERESHRDATYARLESGSPSHARAPEAS